MYSWHSQQLHIYSAKLVDEGGEHFRLITFICTSAYSMCKANERWNVLKCMNSPTTLISFNKKDHFCHFFSDIVHT